MQKYKSSAAAEMGDRGHNRHGHGLKKRGLLCPFRGGSWVLTPRLTQCGLGQGLLPYQMASSSIQPFGHSRHGPKAGGLCPFQGGAGSLSNTTSPGPKPSSLPPYQVASWSIQPFGHSRHGPKIGWRLSHFFLEGAGSPSNTAAWAEAYLHIKWHPSPSSRLATTDIGPKLGGSASLAEGSWVTV